MALSLARSGELKKNTENTVRKYVWVKRPPRRLADYQLYQIDIRRTDDLHILRQMLEVTSRVEEKSI